VPGSPLAPIAALPGVPDAVRDARAAVDELLKHNVLRKQRLTVATEASLRSARASSALDGADFELDWLRSGAVREGHAGAGVVNGALRVTTELASLVAVWRRAPSQALARLHLLAAADLADDSALGRPRTSDSAADPLGIGAPPPAAVVAARLDRLARTVTASSDVPALVVSAVVHGELLLLRPFGTADGVVARGASRLVTSDLGLDPDRLSVPEAGHVVLGRRAYAEALRGFATGSPEGVAAWVLHCGSAIELGAREMVGVGDALLNPPPST
jgi:hypothetical protein